MIATICVVYSGLCSHMVWQTLLLQALWGLYSYTFVLVCMLGVGLYGENAQMEMWYKQVQFIDAMWHNHDKYSLLMHSISIESHTKFTIEWITSIYVWAILPVPGYTQKCIWESESFWNGICWYYHDVGTITMLVLSRCWYYHDVGTITMSICGPFY